jgi:hypothetical protein
MHRALLLCLTALTSVILACASGSISTPPAQTPQLLRVERPGASRVAVPPTTSADQFYRVSKDPVNTGIFLDVGETVSIRSWGFIDFGGAVLGFGAPILDAGGADESGVPRESAAPSTYPAPGLLKNSLICRLVEQSSGATLQTFQCGTEVDVTANTPGTLVLLPNDDDPQNNSRGWVVEVGTPVPPPPAPTPTPTRIPSELLPIVPLTRFEALPSAMLFVQIAAPYPGDLQVLLNGEGLERSPLDTVSNPTLDAAERGWYTADINPNPTPAQWDLRIVPPPKMRSGPGFSLSIRHLSISSSATGSQGTSAPLLIRIAPRLARGTGTVTMTGSLGPALGTTAVAHLTGTATDPLSSAGGRPALITTSAFTLIARTPLTTLDRPSVEHTERSNAKQFDFGLLNRFRGMEFAGSWSADISGPAGGGSSMATISFPVVSASGP